MHVGLTSFCGFCLRFDSAGSSGAGFSANSGWRVCASSCFALGAFALPVDDFALPFDAFALPSDWVRASGVGIF